MNFVMDFGIKVHCDWNMIISQGIEFNKKFREFRLKV